MKLRLALIACLTPAGASAEGVAPICGSGTILGEELAPIRDPGGCGIREPVRVHSAAGVSLDPPPEITCGTARAVNRWIRREAKPAFAGLGGLEGLDIAAGYVCRNVNRAEEGELSEHARGKAVDIRAFRLGPETVEVEYGWSSEPYAPILKHLHAEACGVFGTVLGPGSDEFHQDHFHFDTAERRRAYCR